MPDAGLVPAAVAIGMGATLCMDLWNLFLRRAFGIPSLDYCMLGRWLLHMPAQFRHARIATAAPRTGECATGRIAHYAIGIALALAFTIVMSGDWLVRPTLLPALLYGLATVIFPLFVMQPSLGLGIASSRAPNPRQARLKSVATHAVYGLGLYLSALALPWP